MKQYTLYRILAAAIFLLIVQPGMAQMFKAEMIGGCNLSQVDGDETFGFKKMGLNAGVGVVAPLGPHWALSFETLYSMKGSRKRKDYATYPDGSYRLELNYAEVPLMMHFFDKDMVALGAGASWARLVKVAEWRDGMRVDSVTLDSKVFDRDDFLIVGDMRVRLYKNLMANLRYSYSLDKIARRTLADSETGRMNTRDFFNNVWSFRIIWMINERLPDKGKKDKQIQVE